jgi:hypothetical protein
MLKFALNLKILALGLLVAAPSLATAGTELSTDRFGYTGSYTKYATLADAQAGTNAIGTGTVQQRDLSLYFVNNAPAFYTDANIISTAWYYTTQTQGYGWGNPNNTNLSFLQMYNDPAQGLSPLIGTADSYWTSAALNEFHITASGAGANTTNAAARFGDTDSASTGGATAGTFHSYNLEATISGLNTAVYDSLTGFYESTGDPNGVSVTGTFTALFENTSPHAPSNGFYKINLTLNNTSWAYDNQGSLQGIPFGTSIYGSTNVVPEPSSLVLAGLGGLGFGVTALRRRRKAAETVSV